jgi:hypothetical protein
MPNITTYIIASFATYYLALSIAREDGPFGVFLALRNRATDDNWIGRGLRCIVCLSCWTGLLWAVLLGLLGYYDLYVWPVVWMGLAGASVVIDRYWRR